MIRKPKPKTLLHFLPGDEQQRLKDIFTSLVAVRASEPSLVQLELQFFEVLNMLQAQKGCSACAKILARLRVVQQEQYAGTQSKGLKIKSSVLTIRKFKRAFKMVLYNAIHQPEESW